VVDSNLRELRGRGEERTGQWPEMKGGDPPGAEGWDRGVADIYLHACNYRLVHPCRRFLREIDL